MNLQTIGHHHGEQAWRLIRERMDWEKPMEGTSTVEFTFKPDGDKTKVTWAMHGKNGHVGKLMSLFMDCESMCGPHAV